MCLLVEPQKGLKTTFVLSPSNPGETPGSKIFWGAARTQNRRKMGGNSAPQAARGAVNCGN